MDGENWGGNQFHANPAGNHCARPHSKLLGAPGLELEKNTMTGSEVPVLFELSQRRRSRNESRLQTLQYLERTCKDLLCRMSLRGFHRPAAARPRLLSRCPSHSRRRLIVPVTVWPAVGAVMLTVGGVVSGGGGGGLLPARKAAICITHPPLSRRGAVATVGSDRSHHTVLR